MYRALLFSVCLSVPLYGDHFINKTRQPITVRTTHYADRVSIGFDSRSHYREEIQQRFSTCESTMAAFTDLPPHPAISDITIPAHSKSATGGVNFFVKQNEAMENIAPVYVGDYKWVKAGDWNRPSTIPQFDLGDEYYQTYQVRFQDHIGRDIPIFLPDITKILAKEIREKPRKGFTAHFTLSGLFEGSFLPRDPTHVHTYPTYTARDDRYELRKLSSEENLCFEVAGWGQEEVEIRFIREKSRTVGYAYIVSTRSVWEPILNLLFFFAVPH